MIKIFFNTTRARDCIFSLETPTCIAQLSACECESSSCAHKKNDTCLRRYVKKSVASCVITDTAVLHNSQMRISRSKIFEGLP